VQLNNPGRDRHQGLGLGLAIVARLCRLLEHPLTLCSRVGKGSCFSVTLPRAEPAAGPTGTAAPILPSFARPLAGMTVVLVEDDEAVLDTTTALMRQWGCRVLAAASADAALAQLRSDEAEHVQAIVSDHRLGADNGLHAVRRLRSRCGRDVPALLLSGEALPYAVEALAAEAVTPARKPLPALALRAWLSAQLLAPEKPA